MKRTRIRCAVALSAVFLLAACAGGEANGGSADEALSQVSPAQELPTGHPVISPGSSSAVPPPPPGSGQGAEGLHWTEPPEWLAETPSSSMRRAQYRVPGAAGDAQCVVFYFGPGQGGGAQANVERWADQFGQPDGTSSREALVTEELDVAGVRVLIAEITGIYSGGMTGMGAQTPRPGSMLLGAVVEGPDANWFFKLTGPELTVEDNREQFLGMLRSMRTGR